MKPPGPRPILGPDDLRGVLLLGALRLAPKAKLPPPLNDFGDAVFFAMVHLEKKALLFTKLINKQKPTVALHAMPKETTLPALGGPRDGGGYAESPADDALDAGRAADDIDETLVNAPSWFKARRRGDLPATAGSRKAQRRAVRHHGSRTISSCVCSAPICARNSLTGASSLAFSWAIASAFFSSISARRIASDGSG